MSETTSQQPGDARPAAGVVTARALAKGEPGPGCAKTDPIVVAEDVQRRFGGMLAVDVEHLEIPRDAVTALIGPNGAGKTTLFNLLTGFDTPSHGSWSFNGRALAGIPSFKSARMGQVRTFQLTKALRMLSVLENVKLGAKQQTGEHLWAALLPFLWGREERANTERAIKLLRRFKLEEKKDDYAASLSGGQRKLLEMARALMSEPTFVLLDEPMAGVNPALKQSLLGHILGLRDDGMTVLFVEHDMSMVQAIADWVIVMAEGRVVAEGTPAEVMQDQAVVDAYLGANKDRDLGEVVAELKAKRTRYKTEAQSGASRMALAAADAEAAVQAGGGLAAGTADAEAGDGAESESGTEAQSGETKERES